MCVYRARRKHSSFSLCYYLEGDLEQVFPRLFEDCSWLPCWSAGRIGRAPVALLIAGWGRSRGPSDALQAPPSSSMEVGDTQ